MRREALIVGINQYPFLKDTPTSKAKHLTTPATDAEAIAKLLETHGNFRVKRFPASNIDGKLQVDPDKLVKTEELEAAILDLFLPESGKPPETALLFFAGHGLRKQLRQSLTQGFLATSDTSPSKNLWGLSLRELWEILQQSQAQQQVIWLDCCFSGELLNFKDTELGRHSSGCDRFLIAASRDYEVAYQQLDGKHGVLTGALLAGLNPHLVPEFEWITNRTLTVSVEQKLQAYYETTKIPQSPLISNHGEAIKLIQGRAKPLSQNQSDALMPLLGNEGLATWQSEKHYSKFIGRNDELRSMLKFLEKDHPEILSIVGMGGMGKTAFCHNVVENAYKAGKFKTVAWVRARVSEYRTDSFGQLESIMDSHLTVDDALRKIGEELRIPNWVNLGQDICKLQQEIHKVLISNPCLIIIDGLEDTESPGKITDNLRPILGKSSVILTTREKVGGNVAEVKMEKMSRDISKNFIQQIAQEKYPVPNQNPLLKVPEFQINKVLDVTAGMPLAMKLFVSQIDLFDFDEVIEGLQSVSTERKLYDYLFEASWQKIEQQQDMVSIILLIHLADIPSPISITELYGLCELSEQEVRGGIEKLSKLSLLELSTPEVGRKKVSLHSFTSRYVNETLQKRYG